MRSPNGGALQCSTCGSDRLCGDDGDDTIYAAGDSAIDALWGGAGANTAHLDLFDVSDQIQTLLG